MTVELEVEGGEFKALVDDEHAGLARYRWRLSRKGHVFRYGDKVIKLAHAVAGRPQRGFIVTWRNGNRLDCRRANLQFVSVELHNLKPHRPRGKYRKTRERAAATLPLYQDPTDES